MEPAISHWEISFPRTLNAAISHLKRAAPFHRSRLGAQPMNTIHISTVLAAVVCLLLPVSAAQRAISPPGPPPVVDNGLKLSANHRYLMDAVTARPVFILAGTAWNLGALKLEERVTPAAREAFRFVRA